MFDDHGVMNFKLILLDLIWLLLFLWNDVKCAMKWLKKEKRVR